MSGRELRKQVRGTGILTYGCVGAAIGFIFALTFGAFDPPEKPRDVASNYTTNRVLSTP